MDTYQSAKMKTIFMTLASGLEIRNNLCGDLYLLAKKDPRIRLVAFLPPEKVEKYRPEFEHERCIIEPIQGINLDWKIKQLYRIACFGCIPTRTIWSRNWFTYLGGGSKLSFIVKQFFWYLGHFRFWRAFMRGVEYYAFHDDRVWKPYFDKYEPDVVFGAGLLAEEDFSMVKYAKRNGIPTVGMMRSWDNFTSKGFLRVHPDMLLVQNDSMIEEAVKLNSYPREKIRVVGFPQFDHYFDPAWHISKEEYAPMFGLDPKKKWVSYFGGGLMMGLFNLPERGDHVVMLKKAIERGEIPDAQVLIRPHPGHIDKLSKEATEAAPILSFGKGWNFGGNDMKLLANLVRLSDVTLNLGSTMALEAAVYDKPVVIIAFTGFEDDSKLPWHRRPSVALDNTLHYKFVLDTKGVWRVNNEKELVEAVKSYLENPSLHREGRARLVKELVGPVDGQAGQRIFDVLCSQIKKHE